MRHRLITIAAATALASIALATPAQAEWTEPYGGCDEALAYVGTAGFNQCAKHDALPRTEWMPCGFEDETNCVWDARHRGNGEGRSFFTDKRGTVHYLPHVVAHALLH
jgi:hypothetical protein